jgi:hypothetical protein
MHNVCQCRIERQYMLREKMNENDTNNEAKMMNLLAAKRR